jgi:2-isopropylmalate synthase
MMRFPLVTTSYGTRWNKTPYLGNRALSKKRIADHARHWASKPRKREEAMNFNSSVKVFDTTLRDGEQMPQLAFTADEKLAIARKLDELGVDVIEAGFPVNSPEEQEAVRRICGEVSAIVCGIARTVPSDLDAAIKAGVGMVDVFCSTSDIQIKNSMRSNREDVMASSRAAVRYVKDAGLLCMYTPMDATRTDPNFLIEVCRMAEEEGADWIGLTDTVGVGTPETVTEMVNRAVNAVSVPISMHCHDDFGLATANTLAAVRGGARMVQVCLNGLGERAGNASLEEVVMALKCLAGVDCRIRTEKIYEASRLLERISGVPVPRNKPVVGANAFTHESGIHAAGIMRDARTFEPGLMSPEMVGHRRQLVVGKHAGRHGIGKALSEAGLYPTPDELKEIAHRVHSIAAKGKNLMSADLFAIAETVMQKIPANMRAIVLKQLVVTTGDKIVPTASVQAKVRGKDRIEAQVGVGPVDAAFRAVRAMVKDQLKVEISEYHVDAVTGGSHATVRVSVAVEDETGRRSSAQSAHVDIVMASVDALLTATNHLIRLRENAGGNAETGSENVSVA